MLLLAYTVRAAGLRKFMLGLCFLISGSALPAQEPTPSGAALGLRALGAFSLTARGIRDERDVTGMEAAAELDLGHLPSRRVRVGTEVAFMRTRLFDEYVQQDDASYRDVYHDLSIHVLVTLLMRDPARTIVPYVGAGTGVHVLTSAFGSIPIDVRYNTNVFGLRGAAGLRLRGSTRAVRIETSAVLAREVSRATVGLSFDWLLGDLRRR